MTETARAPTTRQLAKEQTRQRLLDAALDILDDEGETALTTTKVTQLAGVKQPTFYVHFTGMDDLLVNLVQQLWALRRDITRETQETVRHASTKAAMRELFRTNVEALKAHPAVLRLVVRSRLDPVSRLGEYVRAETAVTLENFTATLAESGLPYDTPAEQRRLHMQAEGIVALVENLTLSHLEGRYDDVEEVIDVLMRFAGAVAAGRR
jgi:TetR/AcrR family transcriptional regulator, fatty acid biosynthesis regulator